MAQYRGVDALTQKAFDVLTSSRLVEALDIARATHHIARQGVLVGMGMSLLAMVVAALRSPRAASRCARGTSPA